MRGLVVALLVLVFFAVGCGTNGTSAPSPTVRTATAPKSETPAQTKPTVAAAATFSASAEAICRRMQREATLLDPNEKPSDEQVAELVDSWRSGLKQLDALDAPRDRKRKFASMLAHYRNMVRAIDAMLKAKDETVLAAAAGSVVEGQRGSRAAREAGLDACAFFPEIEQPPADPQRLYDATRDLVPADARVIRDGELECDTSDSCRIEYELDRSTAARMRETRALLRAHDWKNIRSGRTPTGGSWLMANRNDYVATLEFVGDKPPAHCGGRVTFGCSDAVWVYRVEVPEVLTGG